MACVYPHEYETERADRIADEERRDNLSLPRWIELPTGFVDVADIPMSLRDLIIFGDSSAILGLLPLVPNSVTSRLGRMPAPDNWVGLGIVPSWGLGLGVFG